MARDRYRPGHSSPFHEKVEELFNAVGDIVLAGVWVHLSSLEGRLQS